jgi:hypothetical protein
MVQNQPLNSVLKRKANNVDVDVAHSEQFTDNGLLLIETTEKLPGHYNIQFSPDVSSPYEFQFFQGKISALKTTGTIVSNLVLKAGSDLQIKVIPRDQFDNVLLLDDQLFEAAQFSVSFKSTGKFQKSALPFTLNADKQSVSVSHFLTLAGNVEYQVHV